MTIFGRAGAADVREDVPALSQPSAGGSRRRDEAIRGTGARPIQYAAKRGETKMQGDIA